MSFVASPRVVDRNSPGMDLVPAEAKVHMANERGLIVQWQDVLLSLYSGATDLEDYRTIAASLGKGGRKLVGVIGLTAGAPVPDQDKRQQISDFYFSDRYFVANALVFRGSGLRASIIRSVMVGMRLMSPMPIPSTVTGDGREALTWLTEHAPDCRLPPILPDLIDGVLDARASEPA